MPYFTPAGLPSGTAATFEMFSSTLVNATSTGDAGARSDHFPGTSLSAAWTQVGAGPTATSVGNSVFSVNQGGGTLTTYWYKTYTPTGAFRVEARVHISSTIQSAQNVTLGISVRDIAPIAADNTGNAMMINAEWGTGAWSAVLYSQDTGVFTARGTDVPLNASYTWPYFYVALARNGANQWTAYTSSDRQSWLTTGTVNFGKTFTAGILAMRFLSGVGAFAALDFIDVVS